jgi:hypothetical protein
MAHGRAHAPETAPEAAVPAKPVTGRGVSGILALQAAPLLEACACGADWVR